jgi:demethylspheroidene O-methyltransferase
MSVSQGFVAGHVLASYDLGRHRHLLDVAGGDGSFAAAALARHPDLKATVFDLPPVAALAGERLAERGLAARATTVAGNMLRDELPGGVDIVSLIRVLHDHDDEPVQALLRAAHRALSPGGRLLIAEPMAGTRGAEDIGDTYFGMYLWAMGSGRPRTADELTAMTLEAGFSRCREYRTSMPLLVRVLVAEH